MLVHDPLLGRGGLERGLGEGVGEGDWGRGGGRGDWGRGVLGYALMLVHDPWGGGRVGGCRAIQITSLLYYIDPGISGPAFEFA